MRIEELHEDSMSTIFKIQVADSTSEKHFNKKGNVSSAISLREKEESSEILAEWDVVNRVWRRRKPVRPRRRSIGEPVQPNGYRS